MPLDLPAIDEAAAPLRVSRDVVYRPANDGDLIGRKIGQAWRSPRQAVEAYVRARSKDSCSSPPAAEGGDETAPATAQ